MKTVNIFLIIFIILINVLIFIADSGLDFIICGMFLLLAIILGIIINETKDI